MTRLAALMFAATIAIWGLASIPDRSGEDKAATPYRRAELAKAPSRTFVAPTQTSRISALRPFTLVALRPKAASVSELRGCVAPRAIKRLRMYHQVVGPNAELFPAQAASISWRRQL